MLDFEPALLLLPRSVVASRRLVDDDDVAANRQPEARTVCTKREIEIVEVEVVERFAVERNRHRHLSPHREDHAV